MRINHKPTKLLIVGASGTGKTSFLLRYLVGAPAEKILVYDWQGELAERLTLPPVALTTAAMLEHADRHRVTLVDPTLTRTNAVDGLAHFCQFCRAYAGTLEAPATLLLIVDELHRLTDTGANGLPPEFLDCLEFGRRDGIDAVMISQAPNLLHNRIRGQVTEVVAFQLLDQRAHVWLEPLGFDVADLRALPAGRYVWRSLRSGDTKPGRIF